MLTKIVTILYNALMSTQMKKPIILCDCKVYLLNINKYIIFN